MPIVSIIIPTCNRSNCLLPAIQAILAHANDAEIIVSDNGDTDVVREILAQQISSGLVRYQYLSRPVSVVENFERSVALATGDFVICLGDDDCIGPGFNDVVRWAHNNDVDAVFSYADRFIANYFWPGVKSHFFGDAYQARLFIKPYTGHPARIDGLDALREAARNIGSGLGFMPRIYHGLVRREVLCRIREKYGAIFGGVSPDIYSATLISLEAARIYRVDAPFVLPGGSPRSTAGQGAARADRCGLFDVDHIRRFGPDLEWLPVVPAYYGPHNVWAYSMLCALNRSKAEHVHANLMGLIFKAWLGDRRYRKEIFDAMRAAIKQQGYLRATRDLIRSVVNECVSITRRIYWKFVAKSTTYGNLEDIGAALDLLARHELDRGFTLQRVLNQRIQ
jgi:glycosyltransferase involved in cell wall biosynthesis